MPKKIRLGIINSNYVKIGPYTKKGTEIFSYIFTRNLAHRYSKEFTITSFCSGNSLVPTNKESIFYHASSERSYIGRMRHHLFDAALFSKAVSLQSKFDIFHLNVGVGETFLPFARFIRRPIVVTMHGPIENDYMPKFFSIFNDVKNLHHVSISNVQNKNAFFLKARTIYHGIDTQKTFTFHPTGGKSIIWTGRAMPEKGLDEVLRISKKLKIPTKVFPIIKNEYLEWLHREVIEKRDIINQITKIRLDFNILRKKLVKEYQESKLFLFPLKWEEPFGFTVVEAMACGTPVVAYARGSMPEIIKDGETGFLVNPDDETRGDFIIKEKGFEGMCAAVKKVYGLSENDYSTMRLKARERAEQLFNINRMVDEYVSLYKTILSQK